MRHLSKIPGYTSVLQGFQAVLLFIIARGSGRRMLSLSLRCVKQEELFDPTVFRAELEEVSYVANVLRADKPTFEAHS